MSDRDFIKQRVKVLVYRRRKSPAREKKQAHRALINGLMALLDGVARDQAAHQRPVDGDV